MGKEVGRPLSKIEEANAVSKLWIRPGERLAEGSQNALEISYPFIHQHKV